MARVELEMEFASAVLSWVERELELSEPEMGHVLGVDQKTIGRWRNRERAPTPEQRKRLREIAQLKGLVESAFRTPGVGKRWLHQPVPGLEGRTPMSVLAEGRADRVLDVLATHASGAHV